MRSFVVHPIARRGSKLPEAKHGLALRHRRWPEVLPSSDESTVWPSDKTCSVLCALADADEPDAAFREEAALACRFVIGAQSKWVAWRLEEVDAALPACASPMPAPLATFETPAPYPYTGTRYIPSWSLRSIEAGAIARGRVCVGRHGNEVTLFDLETGARIVELTFTPSETASGQHVEALAIALDASFVALSAGNGRDFAVHDLPSGTLRWRATATPADPARLAIVPRGVLATEMDTLVLRAAADGAVIARHEPPVPKHGRPVLYALDVDATGRFAAAGHAWGLVRIHDLEGGPAVDPVIGEVHVRAVRFSPDGAQLAIGLANGAVAIAARDGTIAAAFAAHKKAVVACAWSPDGALLATGGQDGTVRVWRADGSAISAPGRKKADAHASRIVSIAFAPDGRLLSADLASIKVWSPTKGALVATLAGMRPTGGVPVAVRDFGVADGRVVAWACDGAVRTFAMP